ncbi:MAG: glucose-6-phosphate dehydrogenase [Candidatus Taylorbacteria bacterium]|nr:glucose-6-phosphate dehydrogenase [Candidatus Taylorbacteria bacterium]
MDNTNDLTNNSIALHPTIFVILGITGDLASRKLLPALLYLYSKKLLPQRFAIVGFSRRAFSREEFRELIRSKMNIRLGQFKEEDIKHFLDHISYEQGMFDDIVAYKRLKDRLSMIDDRWGQCTNKLFHLSVPPKLYEGILTNIHRSELAEICGDGTGWTRILIEKPFGDDIEMARSLDRLLAKLFKEDQIFRIDHYLAKEAMQNILAFRFTNSMFEPIWCSKFVDKIHIKLHEEIGVEGRGAFYDSIGALKDVGQNHIMQILALIAMDKPKSFSPQDIRKERAKVLNRLEIISPRQIGGRVIRGQYEGYRSEPGVLLKSTTETYFRLEARIKIDRWKNVPIYLESGKFLSYTKTEVDIYFKGEDMDKQNILTFRIQPDEGIKIRFFVKTPGYGFKTESKVLKFKYSDSHSLSALPNDYERLIHDAFVGDQTLFASTDEIMASWRFVTPILNSLEKVPLITYKKGTEEVG